MTTKTVDMDRVRAVMKEQGAIARQEWDWRVESRNEIHVAAGGLICTQRMQPGYPCTFPATALLEVGPRCHHHGGPPLVDEDGNPSTTWRGFAPTDLAKRLPLDDPHAGGPCDCDWSNPIGMTAAKLRHRVLPTPDQSRYGPRPSERSEVGV